MKQLLLTLTVLFVLTGCSNDDKNLDTNNIIGTWKLHKTQNGYTYTFNTDGTFKSSRFTKCLTGKYTVSSDKLTLDYDCEGFTTQIETPSGTFIENFKLEKGYMYLSPTYLTCDEGCSYKFKKISD
ncbi:DUF5640 domain-containing protein [Flavobacterium reichenbachii]|uniref:Lipocalin-like domain-containing protein n=1 Tax=Flavobacterium reichenbachii TaxID=362418 RepID=A0A085ZRX9_9FLAO|nr:hypothetical protein [Flavobacterium reichenbachii]KFF07193.1 hypothetical protein IW19_17525 [Flavobacterium reichenbachii]OXB13314.1 hypothetical protein B0A68_16285 [Flavobacterium reichenbachii]